MKLNFELVLLFCLIAVNVTAQNGTLPSLNIGDPAPSPRVSSWIKGSPVKAFEKGRVYVIEFWATWCAPCKAAMPHLSDLARQYRDKVTIISMDIMERKTTSRAKVKAFVDSMGLQMDYHVAVMNSKSMAASWMDASGESGIPKSFVVNAQGKLAWIGYPTGLDTVLPKIINSSWDVKAALAKRNFDRQLKKLDMKVYSAVRNYVADLHSEGLIGKPDSALLVINEMVRKEPKLKYAPFIAYHMFASLLKTNPHKAYEYGKAVLVTNTYEEPACYAIIDPIKLLSDKLDLPAEIYELGAEAYRVRISQIPFKELVNLPRLYKSMGEWYWRANKKTKALDAQKIAIEALKNEKWSSSINDKAAFETLLQKYENK